MTYNTPPNQQKMDKDPEVTTESLAISLPGG